MSAQTDPVTYEASRALASIENQPDKIHWNQGSAFRDHPYRLLHHQKGIIGNFRIRLLEGNDLQRSYWSALALGPVKHLGLSTAHGEVSSFVSLTLNFEDEGTDEHSPQSAIKQGHNGKSAAVSPVVVSNNNPVWDNSQFEFSLRKGSFRDGQRIMLTVRVDEAATSVENLIPGVPSGDARMIGVGAFDLTELCLGETNRGQVIPGVLDFWVPISMQGQEAPELPEALGKDPLMQQEREKITDNRVTGKIRILASYEPYGLEPQPKDVVALEAFARRNPLTSSCRSLLSPLMPLTVLEKRGAYILAEYITSNGRKACTRIHRNAVFVVERQNLADAAHNLALLPVDVWMSTPIGRAVHEVSSPVVHAARELSMPVLLSMKLVWVAARTSVVAGLSGAQALGSTFFSEGSAALTSSNRGRDPYAMDRKSKVTFVQL